MKTTDFPNILHIYAADIGERRFPNEIYLSCGNGESECWLVNPIGIDDINECFEKYMEVHSVTYKHLRDFGKNPQIWCEILNKHLSEKEVFVSDEMVELTKFQLSKLYQTAKMPSYNFHIKSLQDFLRNELQDADLFMKLEEKAGKYNAIKLDGAFFFHYLIRLTDLVLEELGKK